MLIALVVTSLLRRRLGYRSWRAIHWLAYASWPIAVLHGLGSGTDAKSWWLLALTVVCVAAVVIAVLVRVARANTATPGARTTAAGLAIATPLALAVFALAGPLRPGWAKRAGTPASLLGSASGGRVSRGTPVSRHTTTGPLDHPFRATLAGTATQSNQPGGAIVQLSMRLGGSVHGQMRVRLGGAPLQGGGLSLTGSQVAVTAPGMPSAMVGRVVALRGDNFRARVTDSSGTKVDLDANLNIDQNSGSVSGTLTGRPA